MGKDRDERIAELDRMLFDDEEGELPEDLEQPEEEDEKEDPLEETEETEDPEYEEEEEQEETEEEIKDDEPTVEETPASTVKKPIEDKTNYAFGKLRKEASESKREVAERDEIIKALMHEAGYDDYNEFKTAVREQFLKKEREEKGWTVDQQKEIEDLRKSQDELANLKKVVAQKETQERAVKFDQQVKAFAEQYDLGKDGTKIIYEELQKAGYDVGMLLAQPNPTLLIKGVMSEHIVSKAVSAHEVKKSTRKTVDKAKIVVTHDNEDDAESIQEKLLAKDLAAYRKQKRGY